MSRKLKSSVSIDDNSSKLDERGNIYSSSVRHLVQIEWLVVTSYHKRDPSSRDSPGLSSELEDDPWLGTLENFPTIYHARASWLYDVNPESLQKAILASLQSLTLKKSPVEISVADLPGYKSGEVTFKVGVGNREGFDILDDREAKRLIQRIEERGTFRALDLFFQLHYSIDDGRRHKVHQDQYMVRLAFQHGRVELLLHHLKGVRRVSPDEMVRLFLSVTNHELSRQKYSEVELESLTST